MTIIKKNNNQKREISVVFKWKDQQNNYYTVQEMETRHLFYTVLMIWNHSMPEDAKIRPFQEYAFGEFYSTDYFIEAIKNMLPELSKRDDMKQSWEVDFILMNNYFIKKMNKELTKAINQIKK